MCRKYATPHNPRSSGQQTQREKFSLAVLAWQSLTELEKDRWRTNAVGMVMTGYNLFIRYFLFRPLPSTTPLFLHVVNNMHINITRGVYSNSWNWQIYGHPSGFSYARVWDNSNDFTFLSASTLAQQTKIEANPHTQFLDVHDNDFISLWYNDTEQIDIYFPELLGFRKTLYIADDGSTYWDSAMTNLAKASP